MSVSVLKSLATITLLATTFASVSVSAPALAAGFSVGGGEHLNECQGPERAARALKRLGYSDVTRYAQNESRPYKYMFGGYKPKRDGKVAYWHVYWDACEQEIWLREAQE